ncbi:MAG: hypothetical protein E5X86_19635 [Mesorhizobium sp.]|uniref:hypothetical protein n=1 Tax=Mesorhizobium sp. TaxID=1871066 RepID=UPI001221616F|nr:hypothetical protein [Mesorhizobium sp.]TIO15585.1 MAG: hypothetical protein E5X86_19635 [Mesorhizobium sp.]
MGERTFTGKLVDDRDGFEATASDSFRLIRLEMGTGGHSFTMDAGEAEAFAKWILKANPYGHRRIS